MKTESNLTLSLKKLVYPVQTVKVFRFFLTSMDPDAACSVSFDPPRDVALAVVRWVQCPRDLLSLCQASSRWRRLCADASVWVRAGARGGLRGPVDGHQAFVRQVARGRACRRCFVPYDETKTGEACIHHPHSAVIRLNPPPTFSAHEYWSCCGSSDITSWLSDGCVREDTHEWELVARIHATLERDELRFEFGCLGENDCWDCEQQPCRCGSTIVRWS